MRPRPDAAENGAEGGGQGREERASMRPRPDAAENGGGQGGGRRNTRRFNEAAARCRGKPRKKPNHPPRQCSFNEAAARCRGKHGRWRRVPSLLGLASMRPRPDAAENGAGYAGGAKWTVLQ